MSTFGWWLTRLNNELVFPEPEPPIINILYGWSRTYNQFGFYSFMVSFVTSSELIIFLKCFIILLHLSFFFSFLHTIFLLILYEYVSIKPNDCSLLSSLALNPISITYSVNRLFFLSKSLMFWCDFNNNLWFFIHFLWLSLKLFTFTLFFSSWFISFLS